MKKLLLFSLSWSLLILSCADDRNQIEDLFEEVTNLEQSNKEILIINDNYGHHIYDISSLNDLEHDTESIKIKGYVQMDENKKYSRVNINLPKSYRDDFCVDYIQERLINVRKKSDENYNLRLPINTLTEEKLLCSYKEGDNNVEFNVINSNFNSFLLNSNSGLDCGENSGISRFPWGPVVIGVIALAGTAYCVHANTVDSNNCASVAAGCNNGVQSYEFEGGTCGGGDCNVTCN